MAPPNFEGDFQELSENQLEFIKTVIEEQGFQNYKVTIKAAGAAGDNYTANVKRITVEGENGTLSMIGKIAPTNEMIRKRMGSQISFGNECIIYSEFLPKLRELQTKIDTPEEDLYKFPKCYGANSEGPNEVILIEDLKSSDYNMLDRLKPISDECMRSVLKNLAIYHSLSYVLKNKEPDTFNYFKDSLKDMWGAMLEFPPEELGLFFQLEEFAIGVLDNPEHKSLLKNKVAEAIKSAAKMVKFEAGSRFSVIQHGDAWVNNIMFKFEGESVKDSILIDYQQSKNSCPVYDLLYVIINCTDHESRVKNFYNWLDYYHAELDKSLSNYGLKANYVYPRDQLDADLKRYGKLTFGCCILFTSVLTANSEEATKMKESVDAQGFNEVAGSMDIFQSETTGRMKKRITDVIESFLAFGLICSTINSKKSQITMSQLNIEGDFQDISGPQLEFIKKVVEENGFKDSKVTIKNFAEVGDNYGASVKRVIVEGENGTLSMIAKIAPTTEFLRTRANTHVTFGNEHLMYTKFLPKLIEFQKKEEVPEDELFKFPKCYGSNPEAPNEVILLEDLKCKDYVMKDRMQSLSDECVTDILKSLAVFHSFSYVLKHKEPDTYNFFKDNLKDFMAALANSPDMDNFEVLENFVIEILEDPEHKNIIKNKLSQIPQAAAKIAKLECDSRYAVILHGDAWTNNIMFRFEGETLKNSMLIDYQLSKNASPAYDLLYVLFNCTEYETRHKNFYNWLDCYYTQLEKSLSNFGLKANYVYPRDKLDADLMRYGKMMFGWCIVLCSILTVKPEEAAKIKESMEAEVPVEVTDAADFFQADTTVRLKTRVTGLIKSFVEYGLFI
ncbi:uncharacterized protein LOC111354605 [Spodoptera litura]|uniref:Uncharacterized protein LOC111354605 n=1 Tax=Spodoptera litura TaxID=69820 RepID=A0A9J7E4E2_SPOLT|nr:uncharacterized protein LOC111354605 [Spodoptera litura]